MKIGDQEAAFRGVLIRQTDRVSCVSVLAAHLELFIRPLNQAHMIGDVSTEYVTLQ